MSWSLNEQKLRDDIEALLRAVARAFYDDVAIVVIDYLIAVRFLRQDGKGRLHAAGPSEAHSVLKLLPNKQIRKTLEFLCCEHITAKEKVTGIVERKDRNRTYRREMSADFWYIDYSRAVHCIRYRLHLIVAQLNDSIKMMSNDSMYQCPLCQDLSTESDVQNYPMTLEQDSWQCIKCWQQHQHNPNPPDIKLQLVDNTHELHAAESTRRRLNVQMKMKANQATLQRPGIYDLLACLRRYRETLPSNLPSENGAANFVGAADCKSDGTAQDTDGEGLQVLPGESRQAHMLSSWSNTASTPGQSFEAAVVAQSEKKKRGAEMIPLRTCNVPAKPKAVCRQTTPYFLKNDAIGNYVERSERAMRNLSLQSSSSSSSVTSTDEQVNNGIVGSNEQEQCNAYDEQPLDKFLPIFKDEKKRQESLIVSSKGVFQSTSTYASVDWEDA